MRRKGQTRGQGARCGNRTSFAVEVQEDGSKSDFKPKRGEGNDIEVDRFRGKKKKADSRVEKTSAPVKMVGVLVTSSRGNPEGLDSTQTKKGKVRHALVGRSSHQKTKRVKKS